MIKVAQSTPLKVGQTKSSLLFIFPVDETAKQIHVSNKSDFDQG